MPSGDSRKDFICTTAGYYFGLKPNDDAVSELMTNPALNTFLDDGGSTVLYVRLDGKKIQLANKVSNTKYKS